MVGRPPVQRDALRAQVQNRLVRDWRPGDWLPAERTLADSYGVSRSAMREALQTVPELELVAMKGWRVRPLRAGRIGRVLHVRVLDGDNDVDFSAGLAQCLDGSDAEIIDLHRGRPRHDDAVPPEVAQRLRGADWLVLFSEYGIPPAWEDYCWHYGVAMLAVGCNQQRGHASVCADFADMSRVLVRAIHDRGHRNIAFCAARTLHHRNSAFRARVTGYELAMRDLGLTPEVAYLADDFDTRRRSDQDFAQWIAALGGRGHAPTCLYVSGSRFVARVAAMLARIGLRVPTDLSMAGFGASPDVMLGERRLFTTFSRVSEPWFDLGRSAAAQILAHARSSLPPTVTLVTSPVVMGDSVRQLS